MNEGFTIYVDSQKGDFLGLEGESLRSVHLYIIWELRILSILKKASAQGIVGGVLWRQMWKNYLSMV